VWGPNQLISFMGSKSIEYLKQNTRFKIISICRDRDNSASNFVSCDANYKVVTIHSLVEKTKARYICLKNTKDEDFKRYFTNMFHLLDTHVVSFTKIMKTENEYDLGYPVPKKRKKI